jgi:hypothetical protein
VAVALLRLQIAILFLAAMFSPLVLASLPDWNLSIDSLSAGPVVLENLTASNLRSAESESGVEVRASRIITQEDGAAYGPLHLSCPGDLASVAESFCRGGSWEFTAFEDWPPLKGVLLQASVDADETVVDTRGSVDALNWKSNFRQTSNSFELILEVPPQGIEAFGFLSTKAPQLAWVSGAAIGGKARIASNPAGALSASAALQLSGLNFDTPDGLYAGLGIAARVSARSDSVSNGEFVLEGQLEGGELLLGDFYRDFSGVPINLVARAIVDDDALEIRRASIDDGDALHLAGEARMPLGDQPGEPQVILRDLRLEFPDAYSRYLESVAAKLSLDGLETEGTVTWSGDWAPGTARSGALTLKGFAVNDVKRDRFAIGGLEGRLETGYQSRLSWQRASFAKLELGPGTAPLALEEDAVSLREPLRIPVFGGGLMLEQLSVGFPKGGETDIQVEAALENIDMRLMSNALGWPEFAGTLTGRIPGVTFSGGVLDIGGALDFQVFGGQVLLSDLRVERPFGVLPSLAANIDASDLNLAEVTQIFEFGRIAGRIDGYVHNLRMLDWQPVQFDAWFGTPQGAQKQDISRQAVSHLATIGGGNATALLSGPVLRLFNNFSYKRLGLGCRLQDNVCRIRGIEEQGEAVLLLDGAGIPKISILAYNRSVDWPQLVAELTAVSGGDEVKIGQ